MAAEPEKRIEESLHAYARKRREEAGAPLEMHPATRRILQAEVAKLKAAHPERRPWWHSFLVMWPRFAATVGMVAVLAVGVWVFTQSETTRQNEVAQVASSRSASATEAEVDNLGPANERPELVKQVDGIAPSGTVTDEQDAKKTAEKRAPARSDVMLREELKLQVRDQEPALAAAAPAAPSAAPPKSEAEVLGEKQVALRYDTPVNAPALQPAATLGVPLVTQQTADKSDRGATLYKEMQDKRYTIQNGRELKLADSVSKEGAVPATPAITAGVTLAAATANKPADWYFAQTTNAGVLALGDQLNLPITSPPTALDIATYSAEFVQPASASVATVTELAAANRGDRAKNELSRQRGLQEPEERLGAVALGQEFERQDAAGVPALLQKFRWQQFANGTVQIRDADGSVYAGVILAATTEADADVKAKLSKDETRELDRGRTPAPMAAGGSVRFRASGTNRHRELVVINGELLQEQENLGRVVASSGKSISGVAGTAPPPTTSPSSQSTVTRSAQTQTGVASAKRTSETTNAVPAFTPAAIRGRVQIGQTNRMELRAVRSR
jgi:hypothetical protein